jgi:hypothetical protein
MGCILPVCGCGIPLSEFGHYEVVSMDHGGAACITEDFLDFVGFATADASRLVCVVTREATSNLAPLGRDDGNGVAAMEGTGYRADPGRQQAFAGAQCAFGSIVDLHGPCRLKLAGDPGLACRDRRFGRGEPGMASAILNACERR